MPKDSKLYLDDILASIEKIERYSKNLTFTQLSQNEMAIDAVIRNLAIIGEAVKNLPQELKKKSPEIEWKKIAGLRDILIHQYSGVDIKIIWDILINKLPQLKGIIKKLRENEK